MMSICSDTFYSSDEVHCEDNPAMRRDENLLSARTAVAANLKWKHCVVNYGRNQIVYLQDDPAESVFYIQSGTTKATVVSEQGKEAVVAILGARDFFGEECLTTEARRMSTVSSMTDCVVAQISKIEVVRLLQNEPAFARLFIAYLLARNVRVEQDLADRMLNSSEKRLARLLLLLESYSNASDSEPILARISQETLATIVGTTRSRVSFFLNKFRKSGLIDYNRHIKIRSPLRQVAVSRAVSPLKPERNSRSRAGQAPE
jgi:CRP/FNR family transcriptional regulator, cyclic AMP receptor protein